MTVEDLRAKFAETLGIDPSTVCNDSNPDNTPEWDSMGHLGILSMLDDLAVGEISSEEADSLTSFSAIVEFARRKGILTD